MVDELVTRLQAHNQTLDDMSVRDSIRLNTDTKYVSVIRFHGVPILPPVMTKKRREEIQAIRLQVCNVEKKLEDQRRDRSQNHSPAPSSSQTPQPTDTNTSTVSQTLPHGLSSSVPRASGGEFIGEIEGSDAAMLDSLTRDLASLDEVSLPMEYSGMPLTSTRQQHISRVLGKLSQTLNIGDSLMGTGSTDMSDTLKNDDTIIVPHPPQSNIEPEEHSNDNNVENIAEDANKSEYLSRVDLSSSELFLDTEESRDLQQPARSRPKSPKSTVQFASMVTEIYSSGQTGRGSTHLPSLHSPARAKPTGDYKGLPNHIPDVSVQNLTKQHDTIPSEIVEKPSRPNPKGTLLNNVVLSPDPESSLSELTVPFQTYADDDDEETLLKQLHDISTRSSKDTLESETFEKQFLDTKSSNTADSNCQNLSNVTATMTLPPTPPSGPSQPGTFRKKGHSRQGSYTLEHPSPALLKSCSVMIDASSNEKLYSFPNAPKLIAETHKNSADVHGSTDVVKSGIGESVKGNIIQGQVGMTTAMSMEAEGKEDHINKYLDYVRQYAMNDSVTSEVDDSVAEKEIQTKSVDVYSQSFAQSLLPEDWNKMTHLSQEDIFHLQNDHFETLRKDLMDQQKKQLEHLFQQQQNEQLSLQKDIEVRAAALEQQQSPNIHHVSIANIDQQKQQPQQTKSNITTKPVKPIKPLNIATKSISKSTSKPPVSSQNYTASPTVQLTRPKTLPAPEQKSNTTNNLKHNIKNYNNQNQQQQKSTNFSSQNITSLNIPLDASPATPDSEETLEKQPPSGSYSYISSPTLTTNPKDLNMSLLSTLGKETPKQKLFDNPSPSPSAFNKKLVQRSPSKKPLSPHQFTVRIPSHAYDERMQSKFDRLSALVKGYLTRRLIQTDKVQDLIKTIRDTRDFAVNFRAETTQKVGSFTMQDRGLLERIIAQLQAALLDIHEIFFLSTISEQMSMIAHSRDVVAERQYRRSMSGSMEVNRLERRISSATHKTMERKRLAITQASSENVTVTRPRSAPPQSSTAASQDTRALRQIQGSARSGADEYNTRLRTERPKTAGHTQTSREVVKPASKATKSAKVKPKYSTTKAWR